MGLDYPKGWNTIRQMDTWGQDFWGCSYCRRSVVFVAMMTKEKRVSALKFEAFSRISPTFLASQTEIDRGISIQIWRWKLDLYFIRPRRR